jgi:NAD(P) transhydrogenase
MSENLTQKNEYDLVVLGSGPGGHRAAVQAAKLGKQVLIVEKHRFGGACLHLGTIPSKALREAALHSSGQMTIAQVMKRTHSVIAEEQVITVEHFRRNKIEAVQATGSFVDAHTVQIQQGETVQKVRAEKILIATGTRPRRPADLHFDNLTLFDSDSILILKSQPKTMLVLGAGVIGCEYASIFARMGVQVTLVDSRPELLGSIDREIVDALMKQFEQTGIELMLATGFKNLSRSENSDGRAHAVVDLDVAGEIETRHFDTVLYCLGRTGNNESLNLQNIGLNPDSRGQIEVDRNYQTKVKSVYAVGDIIGAPALAASSSEQGRLAMLHAFTGARAEFPETFPYGIYTIPEISSVGIQESELIKRKVKYVVGKAPFPILARGKMLNEEFGFLKLLVHAKTRRIMGVHVIGTSATELVHIGQVAMAFGATIDFLLENVFNYPTLAEAYKVAAMNADTKLSKTDC